MLAKGMGGDIKDGTSASPKLSLLPFSFPTFIDKLSYLSFAESVSLVLDSPNSVLAHPVTVTFPKTVVIFISF